MVEKLEIIVYGDEAIDTHMLIDNVAPETVLNDKLNGQSVRMIEDITGYRLICDLISEISNSISVDGGCKISDFSTNSGLCSCSNKANYAYYIWKKFYDSNASSDDLVYYKDQFIGAKFDWIRESDKILLKNKNKNNKNGVADELDNLPEKIDILIFYDRHYSSDGDNCDRCEQPCQKHYETIKNLLMSQKNAPPIIFIRTAHESPIDKTKITKEDGEIKNPKEIIKYINDNEKLRKNTIVLIKLNDLKQLGAQLPVKYSWEGLLRSTYTELKRIRNDDGYSHNIVASPLIIVDFDYDGYAAFSFNDKSDSCYAVYNKSNINGSGFKTLSKKGSVPSSTSILQSIVVNIMIKELIEELNDSTANSGLTSSILDRFSVRLELLLKVCYLTIYYYCSKGRGLRIDSENQETFSVDMKDLCLFIIDALNACGNNISEVKSEHNKKFILEHMPGYINLKSNFFLPQSNVLNFSDIIMNEKGYSIFDLCKEIVNCGLGATEIPYISFGKLISIDKIEIESYRHIYNLMLNKLNSTDGNKKPLSFCVFGKPGSGKSFGVTEISSHLGKKDTEQNPILTFNLSQMNSVNDLYNAFIKISDFILTGVTPIVFWDEFDSIYEGKKYGWLKYFLAPMEDGKYYANNASHNVGSCIYVFAGSNVESWSRFVSIANSQNEVNVDSDLSKITDFISRISGYIDVLGPNKDGDDNKSYKLRRAVFIRKKIEEEYKIEKDQPFIMDEDILRSLINLESYKHGNRSLSKLITQFKNSSGESQHIKKYCIPNQLDLYVDKDDFERNLIINTKEKESNK